MCQEKRDGLIVFLTDQTLEIPSRAAILAPGYWEGNISPTLTIVKLVVLLNLSVSEALLILNILKVVFVVGACLWLFKVSKIKKDGKKLKEWEILSFTALLVSILFVIPATVLAHYSTFLVLSFILIVFVIPLTLGEKVVLWMALALFAARTAVMWIFWSIGGIPKTVAYIIGPATIAYILFTILVFYVIRDRAARGYWKKPDSLLRM